MQRVFSRLDSSTETIALGAMWMVFALATPSRLSNFDFRQISMDQGLTLQVSRSAPPMAVIQDEKLRVVPVEPLGEIKLTKGSRFIAAGSGNAWSQLKIVARKFSKKSKAQFRRHPPEIKAAYAVAIKAKLPSEAAPQVGPNVSHPTVRDRVEEPLWAPPVIRSLPRGEEKAPTMEPVAVTPVIEPVHQKSDANLTETITAVVPTVVVSSPIIVPAQNQDVIVSKKSAPTTPSAPAVTKVPSSPALAQNTLPPQHQMEAVSTTTSQPPAPNNKILALDGGSTQSDKYTITGSVELSGGLIATGDSTKVDILWSQDQNIRNGIVDYSTGQFEIHVPTLQSGQIVARLHDEEGRLLGYGEVAVDEPTSSYNPLILSDVHLVIEPQASELKGNIVSAYNVGQVFVPLIGAEIFGPFGSSALANLRGFFKLEGLSADSTMVVEGYASQHWGTRVLSSGRRSIKIPVFAAKMMESFLNLVGKGFDNPDYGVIWGEIKKKGKSLSGIKVKLASEDSILPIYFNELRIPDDKLTATSSNGLYAFAKVPPGLHIVQSNLGQLELPSTVATVSASHVSYNPIEATALRISGQVVDGLTQSPREARVRLIGSSFEVATQGAFEMKAPSSDPVLFLEAVSESGSPVTRVSVQRSEAKNVSLSLYSTEWLKTQLQSIGVAFNDKDSWLIGSVKGEGFRVHFDDPVNPQLSIEKGEPKVFYFNDKGQLDKSLEESGEKGGVFVAMQLQPGLHTVVIQSVSGNSTTTRVFAADTGLLNEIFLNLRP